MNQKVAEAPTGSVVIACKLPHGLVMEIGRPGDANYQRVVLNGANGASKALKTLVTEEGFGLTSVEAGFWDKWYQKHRRLEFIVNKSVFMQTDMASATAQSRDEGHVKTGFERLDPTNTGVQGVEADAVHLARSKTEAAQRAGALA